MQLLRMGQIQMYIDRTPIKRQKTRLSTISCARSGQIRPQVNTSSVYGWVRACVRAMRGEEGSLVERCPPPEPPPMLGRDGDEPRKEEEMQRDIIGVFGPGT